jgi:hypothetical protein
MSARHRWPPRSRPAFQERASAIIAGYAVLLMSPPHTPHPDAPRAHLAADPRLPEVLAKAMRKHGLEDYFEHAVIKLVTGETDPRTMQCCDSGCHPCAKDYLGAAEQVVKSLTQTKKKKRFIFW